MNDQTGFWDDAEVISVYTNEQAVEDGFKVPLFQNRWAQLSEGKPITCTRSLFEEFSLAAFAEMWNGYIHLRRGGKMRGFRMSEDMMITSMNRETIWLIEDGECFTFLKPSEY